MGVVRRWNGRHGVFCKRRSCFVLLLRVVSIACTRNNSLCLSHKKKTGVGADFFPVGGAAACCCPKQTVPCCCAARSLGYTRCEDAPASSVSARHSAGANASCACQRGTRALCGRRKASVL